MVRTFLIGLFTTIVVTGCALGPDYTRPELDIPTEYAQPVSAGETIVNLPWWELFNDPVLQDLVRIAIEENKDLQRSIARIAEARAILGVTRADQFPAVDIGGSAVRGDTGEESATVISGGPINDFSVFGDLSFEIDIWGRYRRATEAERSQLLATEYAHRAITISLVAEVARTYFAIRALDRQVSVSDATLNNRAGATKVINARYNKGIIPLLDVNQAQIEEADAGVSLASYHRGVVQAENALRRLLGRSSFQIPRGAAILDQKLLADLPTGLPAALLERRPDVLASEAVLHSETAKIGIATADRLPRLRLLGSIGTGATETGDLFTGDSRTWGIGGDLLGPLIDFGKSRSRVEVAEARAEQALRSYQQTVINAIQEVEDALIAIRTYYEESYQRGRQVAAATSAAKLSRARYDEGMTSYLEVLDVERSLFDAEIGQATAHQQYLAAIVQLYKALGGGRTDSQQNPAPQQNSVP